MPTVTRRFITLIGYGNSPNEAVKGAHGALNTAIEREGGEALIQATCLVYALQERYSRWVFTITAEFRRIEDGQR